jgi:hypothetical protein
MKHRLWLEVFTIFSEFYGTQRFITVFTTAHHFFLSWTTLIHSTSSIPLRLRFLKHYYSTHAQAITMVSTLHLFQSKSYQPVFPPCTFYISNPQCLTWLYHSNTIWRAVHIMKISIVKSLQPPKFLSVRYRYSCPHPVVDNAQSPFFS